MGSPTATFTDTPLHQPPANGESWHSFIGEHSKAILANTLGYSSAEIDELVRKGIVPRPAGPRAIETSLQARLAYGEKMKKRQKNLKQYGASYEPFASAASALRVFIGTQLKPIVILELHYEAMIYEYMR